jgi:hypothetical protein
MSVNTGMPDLKKYPMNDRKGDLTGPWFETVDRLLSALCGSQLAAVADFRNAEDLNYLGPLKATIAPENTTHLHTRKYGVGIPSLFKPRTTPWMASSTSPRLY